jgi:SNF2 family DNA or RNA helicase
LTIEEKVIERAYKKLALDALVIQQGRLAEQKGKANFYHTSKFYQLIVCCHLHLFCVLLIL